MTHRWRRRLFVAFLLSIAAHVGLASQARPVHVDFPDTVETASQRTPQIVKLIVPTPTPLPTPPTRWSQLDRSMLKKIRLTPADEQIVVLAARQGDGTASRAPHILRVEIRPGVVHERTVMHIRVLTSSGANGVYVRFVIWEIGVPPIGAYRLPQSDRDYPGRRYELFERDYEVPAIPRLYRGRTYQVEVIATGPDGIASGAFVPIRVL
jgi:hypothetical protein